MRAEVDILVKFSIDTSLKKKVHSALVEVFIQNPLWGDLVARFDVTPAQVAALFGVLGSGLGAAGTGVGIAAVIFLFSDHHWWHQG